LYYQNYQWMIFFFYFIIETLTLKHNNHGLYIAY